MTHILLCNIGSSSLKLAVFGQNTILWTINRAVNNNLNDILGAALAEIPKQYQFTAIGHRIVHGGAEFTAPALLHDEHIAKLQQISQLAPLHNPPALAGVAFMRKQWPNIPHYGLFDTAFHQTIPEPAYQYAIPAEWRAMGVRKYGFHGSSHQYMARVIGEKMGQGAKIINCHLGNGCSICAIIDGKSVETTMGFTPLDGLVMGTRSGAVDAGIFAFVAGQTGYNIDQITQKLNRESGLLGISGDSDMRNIMEKMDAEMVGNGPLPPATLAYKMFINRIIHYIGAYCAILGGCDVISFTGGIGENSARVRADITEALAYMGCHCDPQKNNNYNPKTGGLAVLSTHNATTAIMVCPAGEEIMMGINILEQMYK